jgi:hypothetical protein
MNDTRVLYFLSECAPIFVNCQFLDGQPSGRRWLEPHLFCGLVRVLATTEKVSPAQKRQQGFSLCVAGFTLHICLHSFSSLQRIGSALAVQYFVGKEKGTAVLNKRNCDEQQPEKASTTGQFKRPHRNHHPRANQHDSEQDQSADRILLVSFCPMFSVHHRLEFIVMFAL